MQHLAAVQLAEDLQDAGDLAAHGRLRPFSAGALEERAEVALRRVLERQAVHHPAVVRGQREGVEYPDRARMIAEQLAKIRFPQPAVDAFAHLDADRLGHGRGTPQALGEVDLAKPSLPEEPADAEAQRCFRAGDDLSLGEECALGTTADGADRSRARGGRAGVFRHGPKQHS